MKTLSILSGLVAALPTVLACDSCYGPQDAVVHTRIARRMQPEAIDATTGPTIPLQWGQLNVLHTTDTHGWLEGHLKEQNYGADWGDFANFTWHMKHTAEKKGVDLLLIDTGDLHDGNGLSDVSSVDGIYSNPIFEQIPYDLLTIGNHELYVSEVAYNTFSNFSKVWGDKYITSNVQIVNPSTGAFEYIGSKYRYFTTKQGLRIMAFGVLFDFTGNSNVSKVIKAADMVDEEWFINAIKCPEPVDLFLITGHNPVRTSTGGTLNLVYDAIRAAHPDKPIQIFGGHTHIRDFAILDGSTTALESGRYCETLGWLAMSGINSSTYRGNTEAPGLPPPTRKAVNGTNSTTVYARRYLDWNRKTFEYHAGGSQCRGPECTSGSLITTEITTLRKELNLTTLYGCAPTSYCISCAPANASGSIFPLVEAATSATVINKSRADKSRLIIVNTGNIRFDLYKGPFTYDDSFIVSPFNNSFQYIPDVSYTIASKVLDTLNNPLAAKRSQSDTHSQEHDPMIYAQHIESCMDPMLGQMKGMELKPRGIIRRQSSTERTPGYTTTDDFGTDGDDTIHSPIPSFKLPTYVQSNGTFPETGTPENVDLIFVNFFAEDLVAALNTLGGSYTDADVADYLPASGPQKFNTQDYLVAYAKMAWQDGMPDCPL